MRVMTRVRIGTRLWVSAALLASLGACTQTTGRASLTGECAAFREPRTRAGEPFYPKGADRDAQRFVDSTIESGISACSWKRPPSRGRSPTQT